MMSILRKLSRKSEKTLDTKLIRFLCIVLVTLFFLIIFMYYYFLQTMYSEQLKKSNDSLVEQIAISYETIMKHITDSICKIPLYDDELVTAVENYSINSSYKKKVFYKLDSIVLGNQYLFSSYLYYPENDLVYDSDSGSIIKLSEFNDRAVFIEGKKDYIYTSDPHLVNTSQGKTLLMSIVSPIPISSKPSSGILVVNIDAKKLYYDILKKIKAEENMNFFVYNNDNTVLINKDESLLFKSVEPQKLINDIKNNNSLPNKYLNRSTSITSFYYSETLKWNFVLDTTIKTPETFISKLYAFIAYSIVLTILALLVMILIVKRSTKPMEKIVLSYNVNLWNQFLVDNNTNLDEIQAQLVKDNINIYQNVYATLILQNLKTDENQNKVSIIEENIKHLIHDSKLNFKTKLTIINKNHVAIVTILSKETTANERETLVLNLANLIINNSDHYFSENAYISTSLFKDTIALIPMSYGEAMDALNYKIGSDSHILQYSAIKDKRINYEYPYDIEKQLINNIIVGNIENCKIFIEKFFDNLSNSIICLQDSEIKNIIYQLETATLRSISGLPIPIKIDSSFNILHVLDLKIIKNSLSEYIEKIVLVIRKSNENDESNINSRIFDYIEKRFVDEGFNLNIAADDLNLNRNYIAKAIKERTNESFNDFINKKRMNMAKMLLQNKQYSIEEISHKVGFNYSHYFIKVFKTIEGITPGQYREKNCNDAM